MQRSAASQFGSMPYAQRSNDGEERTEVQRSMQSLRNLISETHPRSRLGRMASNLPTSLRAPKVSMFLNMTL